MENRSVRTNPNQRSRRRPSPRRPVGRGVATRVGYINVVEPSAHSSSVPTVPRRHRAASRRPPRDVPRSIAPMLAWARAYRKLEDARAATVCLYRAFIVTSAKDSSNAARTEALALVEELATWLMDSGKVQAAARLMRVAADWDRADPDRTTIATAPRPPTTRYTTGATSKPAPPEDPSENEVTRVFRLADLPPERRLS